MNFLAPAFLAGLAAIAIPALTKYMRRAKTSEAKVQIAKMFDSASAYFAEEHVGRGGVALLGSGGGVADTVAHRCPTLTGKPDGTVNAGVTPAITIDCNAGPGGHCQPADAAGSAGKYPLTDWNNNQIWLALNFQQEQPHFFHYNFIGVNGTTGYGSCRFTAQAFANLDADSTYSTYERSGAADQNGVNGAAGLYINQELE